VKGDVDVGDDPEPEALRRRPRSLRGPGDSALRPQPAPPDLPRRLPRASASCIATPQLTLAVLVSEVGSAPEPQTPSGHSPPAADLSSAAARGALAARRIDRCPENART
jgi:hypothetical protein